MLTSKQIIMLRPLSLSTYVCVQLDYTTVTSKSEVTVSDLIDLYMYIKQYFSIDIFRPLRSLFKGPVDSKSFLIKYNV